MKLRPLAAGATALATVAACMVSLIGSRSVLAQSTTTVTITLSSQSTFWIDANKCNDQGPRGAWLSFIIKNTGSNAANNLTVTFSGFTGTNATYFSAPSDLTRTYGTIAAGAQYPAYFYVDYSAVCSHPQAHGSSTYGGYAANFTVTASSSSLASSVTYNGTVGTDELLTANAAGQATAITVGAGFYIGQLLTQTTTFSFGNNSDLFFQPAGEAGFDAACIRLVSSEITAVTGTVPTSIIGQKDSLWFPSATTGGSGGTIDVTFTWKILCVNQTQALHPWAAAKSGNPYKYTGFASSTIYPPSTNPLTISKSVSPSNLSDPSGGPVTWTVTFTNSNSVDVTLTKITDVLPSCMTINTATATGSDVTSSNSSSVPSAGASGTVSWVGLDLGYSASSTYKVPANSSLSLKYKTNVSSCSNPSAQTNSATGTIGTYTVGPATATLTFGSYADLSVTKTDGSATYTPGSNVVYTVVVSNAGPNTATGATVADPLPTGISSSSWTAAMAGGATGNTSGSGALNETVTLPSGGSITYTVTMAVPASRTGNLVNTATVTAPNTVSDSNSANNSATDTDTQASQADLSVTKSDGSSTYTPGNNVVYTITVSNAGPSNVTGATVADPLPTGISTTSWTAVLAGGATGFTSGSSALNESVSLPVGASITYTVTMAVPSSRTGSLANTATVSVPAGVTDPTPGNNTATDTDTQASSADLSVTKTDGAATYTPGSNVVYTVTVSNAGPSDATGATVSDALPTGITTSSWTASTSGSATGNLSGSGAISETVNLAVGSSITYTVTMAVPSSRTGSLANTASISVPSGVTDPTPGNNSATDTDTLSSKADLSVTKTDGSTTYTPGSNVVYTVVVSNAGPSDVTGATVADALPTGITTSSWTASASGGASGNTSGSGAINETVNLPSGSSLTYTVTMAVPASRTGALANTATVSVPSGVNDPTPGNNSATDTDTQASSADLSITKTDGSTTYTPGSNVVYTVVVSNAGPSNVTGATVADALPTGITTSSWTASASGGATGTASGSGAINESVDLPAGSSITYTVTMVVPASRSGNLANTATVAVPSGVTDPTPANNSATDTDTQASSADLSITKTDGASTYTPGNNVVYTIVVSNSGPSNVSGATVADALPAGITTSSWTASASGGASGNASGSGAINESVNLPAGGAITYTVTMAVPSSRTGNLANTASVAAPSGVTDPTPANNSATDTDTQSSLADLSVTKTDGASGYTPGGNVVYTVVVSNAGPSNVTGATVSDALPSGISTSAWTAVMSGGAAGNASGSGAIGETVNLPAGSSITYTVTMAVPLVRTGNLVNTATVSVPSGVTDPTPANNSATDTDTQNLLADLSIAKTDNSVVYTPGADIVYTISVTNQGPGANAGFTVTDPLPSGTTFVSAPGCSFGSGSVTCTSAGLGSGGSTSWTVTIHADPNRTGCLTNTAAITSSNTADPILTNNSATDIDYGFAATAQASGLSLAAGYPLITANNTSVSATSYNAGTGLFQSNSTPATIRFASSDTLHTISGSPTLAIRAQVNNSGVLTGGVAGNDFTLTGTVMDNLGNTYTGTLLTGEIVAFGYRELGATDRFEFRFVITGGTMSAKFAGKDLGLIVTAEASTFNNSFGVNFTSTSKISAGTVSQLCVAN